MLKRGGTVDVDERFKLQNTNASQRRKDMLLDLLPLVGQAINLDIRSDAMLDLLSEVEQKQLKDVIELMVTFDIRLLSSSADAPDTPRFLPEITNLV